MIAGVMESSGGVLTSPSFASGPLRKVLTPITNAQERKRARQKVKLMKFYVYGKCSISANTLNDPYFRDVLKAGDPNYAIMDRHEVARWVKVEFDLFIIYMKYIVATNEKFHGGNAWAQAIHDGTHLENGEHYQAIGLSFASACRNWTVALAVAHCDDGHAPAVARLLKKNSGAIRHHHGHGS